MHPDSSRHSSAAVVRGFRSTVLAAALAALLAPAAGASGAVGAQTPPPRRAPARTAAAGDTVRYEIRFPNAQHHEGEISATFTGVPAAPLRIQMSRSSPGRYALHEFAKNVYAVKAVDAAGRELRVTRPDPYSWLVHDHGGTVRLTYTLFADRADGTYAGIDRTQAHLNIPATFVWAEGLEARPVSARFIPTDTSWTVATQLVPTRDRFTFAAPDLQYFLDSPTTVAPHVWATWPVSSGGSEQTIRLALHHTGTDEQFARYVDWTKAVVREMAAVYGELPRFDYGTYTFIAAYVPWAAGDGMEHRNSTILTSTGNLESAALGLLGTVSHEFFHAWNVERIRPADLEPFDFTRANMSELLWLGEGFTSYYDQLVIARAGINPHADYVRELSGDVNTIVNAPGRRYHSPVEMSRQAPFVDAAAAIDPNNRGNTFISYYTYGAGLGLALDLELRRLGAQRGDTTLTLDRFMQELWRVHGKPERPYTLDDARAALGRVAADTAFANGFFRRHITGREAPDYAGLLADVGVVVRPAAPGRAWLGDVAMEERGGDLYVQSGTLAGQPIYEAGANRGDRLVTLDGRALTSRADVAAVLESRRPGDTVPLVFESRGRRIQTTITLRESPAVETVLAEEAGQTPDAATLARRARWLAPRAR